MAGWAAATGHVGPGAWALFAILFAWQHPHFFAIAWIFRDDYRAAGFKMLPAVERSGAKTVRFTVGFSLILLVVSLLPTLIGMAGRVYFFGTLLLGLLMLVATLTFARDCNTVTARRLLRASIVYLPLLLASIILDAAFNWFR
jgi:protoheme IX farnesyltransferase